MAKKIKIEKEEILWKDRKRWLGFPFSFTRYQATDTRVVLRRGFFNTFTDEVLVYRIMDLRLTRKFGQKLCGVGTVTLISTDKTLPKLELVNIKKSEDVRMLLSRLIEKQRADRGITGREFLSGDSGDSDDDD